MWSFLNASLVFGGLLIGVPIVLHLAMRRKPKRLEFPPLRFIQRRHDVNRRQLRLRHLLLLALRVALVALAAFALAGPSLDTRLAGGILGDPEEPVAAALVFDSSIRMQYRHENRTRLETAQQMALRLLNRLPPASQVAVLDCRAWPAAFQADLGGAKYRIQNLEAAAPSLPLPQVLAKALRLLGESPLARKAVFVFTDLTEASWPRQEAQTLKQEFQNTPGVGLYLIDVGIAAPVNFALGDLRLGGQVLSSRDRLRLQTEVRAVGGAGQRTVELYLLEPDPAPQAGAPQPPSAQGPGFGQRRPQKRAQQTAALEAGQSEPLEFTIGVLGPGTHQGYVQILGEDGLRADDRRFFTVELMPPWRVLLVAPKPAKQYALYLAQALAPEEHRRSGLARFDCTVISQEELPGQDLQSLAAVCLLDPSPLAASVWTRLEDFVAAGRGLAVFLGRNANSPNPTGQSPPGNPFNQDEPQGLLAGRLLRQARSGPEGLYLAPQNYEHPLLAPLRDRAGAIPWFLHPVYRYWQLSEPGAGVRVVARFSDGGPAILERSLGKGRVITMTTPVSDDPNRDPWNLLTAAQGWPFPALAQCLGLYLVGSSDQRLNYLVGQTAVLQLDPQDAYRSYVLTAPDGMEFRVTPDLRQHVLAVTATDQPGNYRVQAGGIAEGVDRGFSVNLAADQTRLDRISQGELAALLGPIPHQIARSPEEIEILAGAGGRIHDLFPGLIVALAVILALEQVVANRFYKG